VHEHEESRRGDSGTKGGKAGTQEVDDRCGTAARDHTPKRERMTVDSQAAAWWPVTGQRRSEAPTVFENMVGASEAINLVADRIRRFADGFHSILITGQTGTGKELAARALHHLSPVAQGPFVVCNCGAIVPTLFESELFGHVRGAFTGATRDKVGLAELAADGVLFLDEIGEIPPGTQVKLLRLLQDREIQRVGSERAHKVDVRIIAATNRDLRKMVAEGEFREDLFYRLGASIHLPPLCDRKDDIPALAEYFLARTRGELRKPELELSEEAASALMTYAWPGNVRELEHALHSAAMLAGGNQIDVCHLPEPVHGHPAQNGSHADDLISLEECKRRHAVRVLRKVGGNSTRAAQVLQVSRATLYRILSEEAGLVSFRKAPKRPD
jgi:transcriptional regulator with PAS, ATPase and Fis domain